MHRAELPTDEDVEARVNERMTVTLESRFRTKTNLNRERLRRFLPMVEELSREEPELLAMLVDDLYHSTLHGTDDPGTTHEPEETSDDDRHEARSDTAPGRRKKRKKRRSGPQETPGTPAEKEEGRD